MNNPVYLYAKQLGIALPKDKADEAAVRLKILETVSLNPESAPDCFSLFYDPDDSYCQRCGDKELCAKAGALKHVAKKGGFERLTLKHRIVYNPDCQVELSSSPMMGELAALIIRISSKHRKKYGKYPVITLEKLYPIARSRVEIRTIPKSVILITEKSLLDLVGYMASVGLLKVKPPKEAGTSKV